MISVSCTPEPPVDDWDALVTQSAAGRIFQTTLWGAYLGRRRWQTHYFLARDPAGRPRAMLLAASGGLGQECFQPNRWPQSAAQHLLRTLFPVLAWSGGPLLLVSDDREATAAAIWQEVSAFVRREKIVLLGGTPAIDPNLSDTTEFPAPLGRPWATFLVDLRQSSDDLWRGLHRSVRKAVQHGAASGVEVTRVADESGRAEYEALVRATRRRLRLGMPPHFPDRTMWSLFRPEAALEIFVARHQGRLCAGLGVLVGNGVLVEIAAARDHDNEASAHAGDMLRWEIIRWGAAHGMRCYDLAGVAANPVSEKETGIRRYKEKFGGAYYEYPLYASESAGWRHRLITGARRLRQRRRR